MLVRLGGRAGVFGVAGSFVELEALGLWLCSLVCCSANNDDNTNDYRIRLLDNKGCGLYG